MSNKSRGDKAERLVHKYLEFLGYEVEKPIRTKWSNKDFFNLWDRIAVARKDILPTIRFVQVKSGSSKPDADWRNRAEAFPCPPCCTKELWHVSKKRGKPVDFKITKIGDKIGNSN